MKWALISGRSIIILGRPEKRSDPGRPEKDFRAIQHHIVPGRPVESQVVLRRSEGYLTDPGILLRTAFHTIARSVMCAGAAIQLVDQRSLDQFWAAALRGAV